MAQRADVHNVTNEAVHSIEHSATACSSSYIFREGLRSVAPYKYTYTTYVKRRWLNRPLLHVLSQEFIAHDIDYLSRATANGSIRVNDLIVPPNYLLKDNQRLTHEAVIHEPPIPAIPIIILGISSCSISSSSSSDSEASTSSSPELVLINKPCGVPIHPGAAYRLNTLTEIVRAKSDVHFFKKCPLTSSEEDGSGTGKLRSTLLKEVARRSPDSLGAQQQRADVVGGAAPLKTSDDVIQHNNMLINQLITGKRNLPRNNSRESVSHIQFNPQQYTCSTEEEPRAGLHRNACACDSALALLNFKNLRPLHRIDRLTSGIVVFSCQSQTARQFEALFREAAVKKFYLARVVGDFRSVCIDAPRTSYDPVMVSGNSTLKDSEAPGVNDNTTRDDRKTGNTDPLYSSDERPTDKNARASNDKNNSKECETTIFCPQNSVETSMEKVDFNQHPNRRGLPSCYLKGSVVCLDRKNSKYTFEANHSSGGKAAYSDFEFVCYDHELNESLIICYPHTGRTHQLRVQLQYLKHPITNDPCYGPAIPAQVDWFRRIEHKQLHGSKETQQPADINSKNDVPLSHTSGMFLHAWKLLLPGCIDVETVLPNWC